MMKKQKNLLNTIFYVSLTPGDGLFKFKILPTDEKGGDSKDMREKVNLINAGNGNAGLVLDVESRRFVNGSVVWKILFSLFLGGYLLPAMQVSFAESCSTCAAPPVVQESVTELNESHLRKIQQEEKKELNQIQKILEKELSSKQEQVFRDAAIKWNGFFNGRVFQHFSKEKLFEQLLKENPNEGLDLLNQDLWEKAKRKGLAPEVTESMRAKILEASKWNWIKDPDMRNAVLHQDKIKKLAERKIESKDWEHKLERVIATEYQTAKKAFLGEREEYDPEDIKKLRVEISGSAWKSHQDHIDLLKGKSPAEMAGYYEELYRKEGKPALCFVPPSKPEASEKKDGKPREEPEVTESRVEQIRETCDARMAFDNNSAKANDKVKDLISRCVKGGVEQCKYGVESIDAKVHSCASTLRTSGFNSNRELSQERAKEMGEIFQDSIKKSGGFPFSLKNETDGEHYYRIGFKDQSSSEEPSGTCGPRPPLGYSNEEWLIEKDKNDQDYQGSVSCKKHKNYQACIESNLKKPRRLLECQPKNIEEAMSVEIKRVEGLILDAASDSDRMSLLETKKRILEKKDPYLLYRQAKIEAVFKCKLPKEKPAPFETKSGAPGEKERSEIPFVECFQLSLKSKLDQNKNGSLKMRRKGTIGICTGEKGECPDLDTVHDLDKVRKN